MTRTVASLTAAAMLCVFTSALAQAPLPVPDQTAPLEVPPSQDMAPATAPATAIEAPKGEGDKAKHDEMKRGHRERDASGADRKKGNHQVKAKYRDKHENGDKRVDRMKRQDRVKHGNKDQHEAGNKHEKN
ncbi:MAG: hypothetical protein ACREJN_19935 [Nitrospiraceae bacterium]